MPLKQFLLFALFLIGVNGSASAQITTPNIDFETGTTSGWYYYRGTNTCPGSSPIWTMTSCAAAPGLHTIMTTADVDYYGGFPAVANGLYSLKLGRDTPNYNADGADYHIHVPTGGAYTFIYNYAFVLQDPGHPVTNEPRFEIKVTDSATGLPVPCNSFSYIGASSLGFIRYFSSDTYCLPWTAGKIDLSGMGGKTVIVSFKVGACTESGHWAYAYIDITPGLFASVVSSCGSPTITLNGPAGYASYYWCDSASMGTSLGTTQNLTITTPGVPTKYAVIVTPAPGYGCVDTLYTEVFPIIPCSGTPAPGTAYTSRATVCGMMDTLKVAGYSGFCGLTFQWQYSPDNIIWSNIVGATQASWPYYHPYISMYYRCIATCILSGSSAVSSVAFAPAIAGVGLSSITVPPSSTCDGAEFYISACGVSSAFRVASFYGDGISDTNSLTTTGVRHADFFHHYPFAGTYSIRQVLYDGALAVDSVSYSYSYDYCSTLPLKFYYDVNANCTMDYGETNFDPILTVVDSNSIPIDTISSAGGFYYLAHGNPGDVYSFRVVSKPAWMNIACPSAGIIYDTIKPLVNYYKTNYIGFTCVPGSFDLAENAVVNSYTNNQKNDIYVSSTSPCSGMPSIVTAVFSPKYSFDYCYPVPSSVVGNTITWSLSGLTSKPYNLEYIVKVYPALAIKDTVQSRVIINPETGDGDTSNNSEIIIDTLLGSHDPNYISVLPDGCLPSGAQSVNLKYTIQFENTGNDTAHNIYVMDTLPDNVDPKTLRLVAASAQMDIAIMNVGGHNIVKFDFPHINLLDSSHHGQCDGMVIYNIKTRTGLPTGASIQNHAGIFFDYNAVVLTNTVENTIGCPILGIAPLTSGNRVELYPNPATDELTIMMDKDAYTSFTITDVVGQALINNELNAERTRISIKDLPAGLYYVTLKGNNGTTVQRFIKL